MSERGNDFVFIFTEKEMKWLQEAYFEHFLDNRYEHEGAEYYPFMMALGKKIKAIDEDEV